MIDMTRLEAIKRLNGCLYQPKKLVVESWDNEEPGEYGVFVIGTHDLAVAQPLADKLIQYWYEHDMIGTRPEKRWIRLGYGYNGPAWIDDFVRGRAAIQFTADYPE